MKRKKSSGMKSMYYIYSVFFFLLFILITFIAGLFLYVVSIQKPDGKVTTSAWPKTFTEEFGKYIYFTEGLPQIKNSGVEQLQQYELWFQLLNENGIEILSYGGDASVKRSYSSVELLDILSQSDNNHNETIFIGTYTDGDLQWNYLIGFPINITKISMYLNGNHFTSGKSMIVPVLLGLFFLIVCAGLVYGLWITRQMNRISKAVVEINSRTYYPIKTTGAFGDVYVSLNHLDLEIRRSDNMRDNTERLRKEWIANITHDLKTPLSPIRGYAEVLSDPKYEIDKEDIRKYGMAIQKNTNYVEQLINDLKLIYQIDHDIIPMHMKKINVNRQLKEIVIDLLNSPEYADRNVAYKSDNNNIYAKLDISLFRRAINNLIINAIIHNPVDTKIVVTMMVKDEILICISDNGNGLTKEEKENLFNRYYRGTNIEAKSEGSGLGMAIVKQIMELHDGKIEVQSVSGEGTDLVISLPIVN